MEQLLSPATAKMLSLAWPQHHSRSRGSPGARHLPAAVPILRRRRIRNRSNQLLEKLRTKRIEFSNGIVRAIAQELLRILQREINYPLCAHDERQPLQDAPQQ